MRKISKDGASLLTILFRDLLNLYRESKLVPDLVSVSISAYKILCEGNDTLLVFDPHFGIKNWCGLKVIPSPFQKEPILFPTTIALDFKLYDEVQKIHEKLYATHHISLINCKELNYHVKRGVTVRRPDKTKIENFGVDNQPKLQKLKKGDKIYEEKLKEMDYGQFTYKDWGKYFADKAKEKGVKYIPNTIKDKAILNSVMREFTPVQIKVMIDFIFDSDQDVVNIASSGIWMLSKSWLSSIYNNSVLWKNGEYKTRKAKPNTIVRKPVSESKISL